MASSHVATRLHGTSPFYGADLAALRGTRSRHPSVECGTRPRDAASLAPAGACRRSSRGIAPRLRDAHCHGVPRPGGARSPGSELFGGTPPATTVYELQGASAVTGGMQTAASLLRTANGACCLKQRRTPVGPPYLDYVLGVMAPPMRAQSQRDEHASGRSKHSQSECGGGHQISLMSPSGRALSRVTWGTMSAPNERSVVEVEQVGEYWRLENLGARGAQSVSSTGS